MTVIKRDGRQVEFDPKRIVLAIEKAMSETEKGIDHSLAQYIAEKISSDLQAKDKVSIETIQDQVESLLMGSDRREVAKKYILYRAERTKARESSSGFMREALEKIQGKNVQNANANVDESSFGGRKAEASGALQKRLALEQMPQDIAEAHRSGLIYEHDLDSYNIGMHNCLFINFQKLFTEGFSTRNGDVRPPTSFSTACQLVAVIFQLQSQNQYGGVGSVHIDYDLAPYVAKSFKKHMADGAKYIGGWTDEQIEAASPYMMLSDEDTWTGDIDRRIFAYAKEMMEREGKQSAQALYHNLNTLESRAGSQVPFTSINLGRDTSPEGRLVTRWLLEASIEGIGKHHVTSIFPISIFSLKKGVNMNPEDPNYDLKQLAIKSMSCRIYPNFCMGDFPEAHEDPADIDSIFSTMGCRTMIGYDRHGLGYKRIGRGNNNPITIILPKLGIEYGIALKKRETADIEGFWNAFDDTLKLVEKAHLVRWNILKSQSPKAAPFMYENGSINDADKCKENVEPALIHNTFAIGYLGVAEMCQALFGRDHVQDAEVHAFALKVVERINRFAKEASERNNLNFSCSATPAESLCYTALKNLRTQYGVLPNITDREWLTNSHHTPVWEKVSIFDKLRIEAPFCRYATGGCITYVECESTFMKNTKAIEDIIDYASNLGIPYLAFNFPIDTCMDCGYQGEFDAECPECGSQNIVSLRRVTGYLSSDYRRFNNGKRAEVEARVKHTAYTTYGNS